ncbi:MAG: hypothetical protein GQ559_11625 [Desulfobulbaceae bacterium]|nr:hypothetical protein [Desulfobulbaceae bacterium]
MKKTRAEKIKLSSMDSQFTVNLFHLVLSSLVINLLALAMPIMMLQTYDRILPSHGYGTLTLLVFGVITGTAIGDGRQ